jgi:ribosomal protein S17
MVLSFTAFMKIEKKCWPEQFQAILEGKKKFDLRLNDFKAEEGDILVLKEFNPKTKSYTGRKIEKLITYVLKTKDLKFWPKEETDKSGFQIMSLD